MRLTSRSKPSRFAGGLRWCECANGQVVVMKIVPAIAASPEMSYGISTDHKKTLVCTVPPLRNSFFGVAMQRKRTNELGKNPKKECECRRWHRLWVPMKCRMDITGTYCCSKASCQKSWHPPALTKPGIIPQAMFGLQAARRVHIKGKGMRPS